MEPKQMDPGLVLVGFVRTFQAIYQPNYLEDTQERSWNPSRALLTALLPTAEKHKSMFKAINIRLKTQIWRENQADNASGKAA